MPDPKKKKQELPATRQDSLAVYNNALEKEKFYKNNKDYKLVKEDRSDKSQIDFKNPNIVKSLISEIKRKNIRNIYFPGGTNNMGKINDETKKRIGQVTKNTYSAPDFAFNEVDYYYNPKSPRILISDKIKPQGSRTYESVPKLSDISSIPYYDPLAVKPFDLLTEAEKTQRVKKYGRDGVPDSYGKSKTDIRKPNITVGKQVKESENKGMVYNDKLINKPKVKQIVKDTPQVQSIPKLNPVGLQFMNPTLNITIPNIPIQAKIPKSYSIQENINQNFGGSQTNYKVDDINLLPTNDLGPGNTRKITPQFAYGGNLNNNMNSNQLTHFNEGGSHESNPNGGIPLGDNALVEQNETKKGNYIYSDRLYINEDLVKQFNLPNNIKGKTFANASKVIEKPFKDKNSNPDKATQKEHLDRLKQAQEALKAHEVQVNQSLQANSQEIPDQMNGDIPEGMEQFSEGGFFDNIAGLTQNPLGSSIPGLGVAEGVIGLGALSQGIGANKNVGSSMLGGALAGGMAGSSLGPVGIAGGIGAGLIAGGLGSGKAKKAEAELGASNAHAANAIFRDKQVQYGVGGYIDPFKKIVGDVYNKYNNPLSQGTLDDNTLTADLVKQYRNKNMFPKPALINDSESMQPTYDSSGNLTTIGTLNTKDLTKFPKPRLVTNDSESMQPVYDKSGALTTVGTMNATVPETSSKSNLFSNLSKIGNYAKQNITGESLRYAPVAMNALQLAKLKRPGQVSLNRLSNTYKPGYIDEAGIQNRLDSENQNTINALTNSSGGSEASLRAGILGSQAARLRARGDAYAGMQQYNNSQDAAAQNFKLGIDQANIGQANLQQDINDRNMGNYDTQKSKLLGQIGTDLGSIGKEKVFAKKAGQMFGYDENGNYIITPDGKKTYTTTSKTTISAYGGFLKPIKNTKGY